MKDALEFIMDNYINNKDFLDSESRLYIEYKDGSYYYLSLGIEEGKFKKTGIKSVLEDNPGTYVVYGKWEAVKTDSSDNDENCTYIINPL